jgi:hypothetical protein
MPDPEFMTVNIDCLSDWMPKETDEELHDRIFGMTNITATAFGWEQGGDDFFKTYNRFLDTARRAQEYHDHLVLMSLLTVQDLVSSSDLGMVRSFESADDIEDSLRTAVRRLMLILEHALFGGDVLKSREYLESLPRAMTNLTFTFVRYSQDLHDELYHTDAWDEDSEDDLQGVTADELSPQEIEWLNEATLEELHEWMKKHTTDNNEEPTNE